MRKVTGWCTSGAAEGLLKGSRRDMERLGRGRGEGNRVELVEHSGTNRAPGREGGGQQDFFVKRSKSDSLGFLLLGKGALLLSPSFSFYF